MHTRLQNADGGTKAAPDGEIRAEQIRLLYEHAPGTYLATLGGATIAVILLWRELSADRLLPWLVAGVVLTAARFMLLHRYRRAAPGGEVLERWGRYFTAGSMAAAAFWGSAAFLLFIPGNGLYNAFMVLLIAGMMAGAGYSLSVFLPSFHAFVLPVGAALLVRLLTVSGFGSEYEMTMLAFGGLTALFVPLVYFFGRKSEASLVKLLRAQSSNRELGLALSAKVAELERTNRSLADEIAAHAASGRAMRENQEKLRLFELAITTLSSGVVFTDPLQRDNPVVYMNPAFASISGYTAEEMLGRDLSCMNGGDEESRDVASVRDALRGQRPCTLVVRNYRKDGTPFWNEMSICPLHDAGGRVVRFVIIQNDVTPRIEMEGALRKTRDELQAILDNTPALIFTKDLEGRMTMVNRQWQQLFRMQAGEAIGRRVHEFLPPAYADTMRASDLKIVESGEASQLEQIVPCESGVAAHLTTKFPLRDASGKIYGICGISTDITDRKRELVLQGVQHQVSRVIAESATVSGAMRRVLHVICESTPWDWGAIHLVDRARGALVPRESWCDRRLAGTEFARLAMSQDETAASEGLMARACQTREPAWIADMTRLPDTRRAQAAVAAGLHAAVAMPILLDSSVIGVLEFFSYETREPERAFLRLARSIGQQLGQFAQRRDAEEQTRRAEERLELALEGSELALWDWNIGTGEIYLSPRWAEMLGLPVAATYTTIEGLTEFAHPDDRASIRQAILRALRGRSSSYSVVHRVRIAGGSWIWIESTGKVVERDGDGRALRMAGTNADVTSRLAGEEELRRTRNELQAILDNSPAMIYAKDITGRILVANRPALRSAQSAGGKAHPAAAGLLPADVEVIEAQRPMQAEEVVIEEDGAHTYICTRFPLRQAQGEIYAVCAIATDITDRKRMEAALAESEDRFRQFAESVNVAFWIVDVIPDRLVYANPALQRIIDLEEDANSRFQQRKIERVHAEDRAPVSEAYGLWVQSRSAGRLDMDYRIARSDGTVRWVHDHAVKLQDHRGEAFRILGITEDITDRKRGEEELEQTRTFLESIIENLPITIFVKDAGDFRYLRINKAGEELLGFSREELLGKADSDFMPAEEAQLYLEKDRQVLAAGTMIDIPEEPVSTRHRGRRYLHTKKIPIVDGAGAARYVLGIAEDVTERKEASEAIQAMNSALAKKAVDLASSNEELEAFAYSVSHDLRAPLRHINGFINLLRDHVGESLDAASQRYLGKIQSASNRMSALIDELLALSRMARMEMRYTRVSLDRLVHEVVEELASQAAGREVDWKIGPLPYVNGDRILLRQALFNLVDNALKYTALESRASIEISSEQSEDRHVIVSVRDNGVGFDMKYAHKLFGVFQRLHRQEEFPGTGIGLAHVRRIIERHGGRVWAQATRGEGAAFFIALPRVRES